MYSVLIQNKKTIESFHNYHSLFMEVLNTEQVGVCRWIESGTTVETALPELLELIDDKEEWRAVIIRLIDEDLMRQYECSNLNPYDFRYYHDEEVPYGESPIPLVRLTHMLGQIPAPDIRYAAREKMERGKAVKIIYEPVRSEEDEKKFRNILDKYEYDGPSPSEIVIISVRMTGDKKSDRNMIQEAWTTRNEIDSSDFWKINRYSNLCRFVVYDTKKRGNIRREADLFKFWLSVLLLINNEIETDELQAYRLYRIKPHLDRSRLQKTMQSFVDDLMGAQFYMNQILAEEDKKLLNSQHKLPEFSLTVPVVLETPRLKDLDVSFREFSVTSVGVNDDLRVWNSLIKEKDLQVREAVHKTMISLEDSADRMRDLCSFDSRKVEQLNKFQKKRMNIELHTLYSMVLSAQKQLPDEKYAADDELRDAEDAVKETLKNRISNNQVYGTLGWIILLSVVCIIPGIAFWFMDRTGDLKAIISAFLLLLDVILLPLTYLILVHREKLKNNIKEYNDCLNRYIIKITENTDLYSQFLSAIASHSRGSSYLKVLESRTFQTSNIRKEIDEHLEEIDHMVHRLERWNRAFHIHTDFSEHYYREIEPDIFVHPKNNRLYTFEYDRSYTIPLNESGCTVQSPFDFVSKLELTREELYDYHENS